MNPHIQYLRTFAVDVYEGDSDQSPELKLHIGELEKELTAPIDMVLFCPMCHEQHIDAPNPDQGWTNPPHKSHLCHKCGTIWRPCDRPTYGVRFIETMG